MINKQWFVGSQVAQVIVGQTFTQLIGFSSQGDHALTWWMRFDDEFEIVNDEDVHRVKFAGETLVGAAELVKFVGKTVDDFAASGTGMHIQFNQGSTIRMSWDASNQSCAQVDVSSGNITAEPRLIASLVLPDDL